MLRFAKVLMIFSLAFLELTIEVVEPHRKVLTLNISTF